MLCVPPWPCSLSVAWSGSPSPGNQCASGARISLPPNATERPLPRCCGPPARSRLPRARGAATPAPREPFLGRTASGLHRQKAAIDGKLHAGDVGGLLGRQEKVGVG